MSEDYHAFCGFSCPHAGLDRQFLEMLVAEHARQVVEGFLKRHGSSLVDGAGAVLETWISSEPSFEPAWHWAFGDLHASLVGAPPDMSEIRRCAGAVALRLHEFGYTGEWRLELEDPVHFCFQRWVLPASKTIRVSATPEMVWIQAGHDRSSDGVAFQRSGNAWQVANGHAPPEAACAQTGYTVLAGGSISRVAAARLLSNDVYDFSGPNAADTHAEVMVRTCDAAVNLVAESASIYRPWISQVTRALLPIPAVPGKFHSASDSFSPGVICVSNQESPCVLAELLVHEATHQYCYILRRLGPIDDGSDQTLYYSPFRRMDRPIAAIVTAYHAFANVLLFYRMVREYGLPAEQQAVNCDERIHDVEEQLGSLEPALQTTTALTPIGRALWEPLYERVHGG